MEFKISQEFNHFTSFHSLDEKPLLVVFTCLFHLYPLLGGFRIKGFYRVLGSFIITAKYVSSQACYFFLDFLILVNRLQRVMLPQSKPTKNVYIVQDDMNCVFFSLVKPLVISYTFLIFTILWIEIILLLNLKIDPLNFMCVKNCCLKNTLNIYYLYFWFVLIKTIMSYPTFLFC